MLTKLIYLELELELLLLAGANNEEIVSKRNNLRKELQYYKTFQFVTFSIISYDPDKKYKGIFIQDDNLVYYKDEHNGEVALRVNEDCVILD